MAVARITTPKPLGFSKTVRAFGSLTREPEGVRGRPRNALPASIPRPLAERLEPAAEHGGDVALEALVREWLLELKVMGRSPRTIEWYAQRMRSYLAASNATRLSELTAFELKRFLGELRDRGLAPNTIHGFFQTRRWCGRGCGAGARYQIHEIEQPVQQRPSFAFYHELLEAGLAAVRARDPLADQARRYGMSGATTTLRTQPSSSPTGIAGLANNG